MNPFLAITKALSLANLSLTLSAAAPGVYLVLVDKFRHLPRILIQCCPNGRGIAVIVPALPCTQAHRNRVVQVLQLGEIGIGARVGRASQ